jgi:hypothetical protein
LPVLFFGDLFSASIATIGINPSRREYLNRGGEELDGPGRRFETLRSLGVVDRGGIDDVRAQAAIARMRAYFDPNKPIYNGWFNGLSRVIDGMGFSYSGRSAAHLDLVQEATDPVWSGLFRADRAQATLVLRRDVLFLRRQIEQFPLRVVILTSARVMSNLSDILPDARIIADGTLARIRWNVRVAETPRGRIGVAGWNIPLARPTGLNADGQRSLGKLLATELKKAGVCLGA